MCFTRFLHTKLLCSKFCCSIFKDRSGVGDFHRATFLFYHSFSSLSIPFSKFLKKVFDLRATVARPLARCFAIISNTFPIVKRFFQKKSLFLQKTVYFSRFICYNKKTSNATPRNPTERTIVYEEKQYRNQLPLR